MFDPRIALGVGGLASAHGVGGNTRCRLIILTTDHLFVGRQGSGDISGFELYTANLI